MLIGYARVSTIEQNLNLQTDALRRSAQGRLRRNNTGGSGTRPRPRGYCCLARVADQFTALNVYGV